MTKRKQKPTTKTKPQDIETEQTPAQKYEKKLRQTLNGWPEQALQLLAEDIGALDAPADVREIKPRPLPAALRQLVAAGETALNGWTVMPPAPPPAEFKLSEPSETAKARAAQIARIEASSVVELDMRLIQNQDRIRAGLTPFPEPDEAEAESEPNPGAMYGP